MRLSSGVTVLSVCLALSFCSSVSSVAQNSSQRPLVPPVSTTPDVAQQLQLLQMLQLMLHESESPDAPEQLPTPEEMRQIQEALKTLGVNPQEMVPPRPSGISNQKPLPIPPELLRNERFRRMIDGLRNLRENPSSANKTRNNPEVPRTQNPASSTPPLRRRDPDPGLPDNRELNDRQAENRDTTRDPFQQPATRPRRPRPSHGQSLPEEQMKELEVGLEKLKQLLGSAENDIRSLSNDPDSISQGEDISRRSQSGTQLSSPDRRPMPRPGTAPNAENLKTQTSNSLESIIRRIQQNNPESPGPSNRLPDNTNSNSLDSVSTSPRSTSGVQQNPTRSPSSEQASQRSMLPDPAKIRAELDRKGLQQTWKDLVRQAKSASRQRSGSENQSGNPANTGVESGLVSALDGFGKQIAEAVKETAKEARFQTPRQNGRFRSPQSPRSRTTESSTMRSLRQNAKGFFDKLASNPMPPPASPSGTTTAGLMNGAGSGPFQFPERTALWIAAIAVAAFLLFRFRHRLMPQSYSHVSSGSSRMLTTISTSRDVIRAFHQITGKASSQVSSWWTHQMAAETLASVAPQTESAVATLSRLYEEARYSSDDVQLSAIQIAEAQKAFQRCEASV